MDRMCTCAALAGAVSFAMAGVAVADPVTFAQVNEGTAGAGVLWTNNGNGTATMNTATAGGDLVAFSFGNVPGLPAGLGGALAAIETINGGAGVTTTAVALSAAGYDFQPINAATTISYNLVTPIDGMTNLLTVNITPDAPGANGLVFFGQDGGSGASSSTSQPLAGGSSYTMTFSSAFLQIDLTEPISADFGYSALAPAMQIGAGGQLGSFTAEDTATFSGAASPANVREPASLGVLLAGVIGLFTLKRSRLSSSAA